MMSITPSFPSSKNLNQAMMSVSKSMKNLGDSVHNGYSSLPTVPAMSSMTMAMPEISTGARGLLQLRRTNSNSNKKVLERHSQVTNIFCSEMVGLDSIIEDFDQVLEDQDVVRVEIEDLLHSTCYDNLSSQVGKVVFANDRSWQMIQFLDSFDMMSGFKTWQKQKEAMMRDYEVCWSHLPGSTETKNVVTFMAVVTIQEGTRITDFLKVLKKIKSDSDVFSMALYGITGAEVAHEDLASSTKVNWNQQVPTLQEQLSMELKCGWREPEPASMLYLSSCLYQLKLKVNAAQEEEMALARAAKHHQEEASEGGCSLQAMRRSLTQRAGKKDLDSGGGGALLKRRPRSSLSLQRSLSDAGDRPITTTTTTGRQPRRSRSKGSLTGLQRTQSDSGDVYRRTSGSSRRAGRRNSRNTSLLRRGPSSSSSQGDLLAVRRGGVGRSYSDSGDHDVMPKRPTRKSLSPSSSHSDERRQTATNLALSAAAIYQMKAVASAMDSISDEDDRNSNSVPPRSSRGNLRRAVSDCGDERRVPRTKRTSSRRSLKRAVQDASRAAIDAIDADDYDDDVTAAGRRRRSPPLRSASDCGDDRYHRLYNRSTKGAALKRSLSKPPRKSAFEALVNNESLVKKTTSSDPRDTSPNSSSRRPKPTRSTPIEPLDTITTTADEQDRHCHNKIKKGTSTRKSEPSLRRVLSDKSKQTRRSLSTTSETSDEGGHTSSSSGLMKINKNKGSRKSEPSFRRVLSDNPKERRSATAKQSSRRKSDPTSELKKAMATIDAAAAAWQDAGDDDDDDEDMITFFGDDDLELSDSDDDELTEKELRSLRTSTGSSTSIRGRPVAVAPTPAAAASSSSPMRNARWQSRSPVHSPTRSTSPFAQTTASCALRAAEGSYSTNATGNDKKNSRLPLKQVDDLLYDSEYSLEDELEAMQLKELQFMTNSGSRAMSLNDLMAMRKTLDAAIASLGEATPRSSELDDSKPSSSAAKFTRRDSRGGEGPDYDWERGVFCQKHATPSAA